MSNYDSLLYPVFDYLRRHGVPLGVSEYLLVGKTLREGVGLEDADQLRRLCRLLWAKSQEDQELFDVAFAEFVEPRLQPAVEFEPPETPPDETPSYTPPIREGAEPSPREDEFESEPERETPLEEQEEPVTFHSVPLGHSSMVQPFVMDQPVKYHLTPHLPLGRREMAGAWRHLRRLQRTGPAEELDVERTIEHLCQAGFFLGPALRPRRRNQAGLVLLIDQNGSMAPFSLLIEALVESILRGGLLGRVSLFYFHDCPEGVLYKRSGLSSALSLEEILTNQVKNNSVLIISDAGAARGDYDQQRVEDTHTFLKTLDTYTYLYAWLNPMPVVRWTTTTAEDITNLAPMFPLDREGLNDAINILRGYPFPPGVDLNG